MTIQKSGEDPERHRIIGVRIKLLLIRSSSRWSSCRQTNILNTISGALTALLRAGIKGKQKIRYRTLFGVIPVSGLRVYRCRCEESDTKTVSLLSDWAGDYSHPALKYIETRWASMISYE